MKTYIKLLACLSFAAALCSCNEKATYTTYPFIRFEDSSYPINENAGTVKIPVYAYNKTRNDVVIPRAQGGPENATFVVYDGSAKKDVDFTVSPANGVLSFDEDGVAYIELTIDNKSGVYTGNLNFSIELTGAGDGYTLAGSSVCSTTITINDLDHPLAEILGEYDVVTYYFYSGSIYTAEYVMELVPVDGDVHSVACTGINKMASDFNDEKGSFNVIGAVSEDMKTITFPPQSVKFSTGNGEMWLYSTDYVNSAGTSTGYYAYDEDIVYTSTEDGIFTSGQGAGFIDDYVWPSYGGFGVGVRTGKLIGADFTTTWTKK